MKLSSQLEDKIIQRFFDLYITAQYKYLSLKPNGIYITYNSQENENHQPLKRWHIREHLQDKHTIGIFAPDFVAKFICFDIDVNDKLNAKWTTYKLVDRLIEIGIPADYIYISTSGNKGYHVDIYFNDLVLIEVVHDFYNIVMSDFDMNHVKGEIELRPTTQGVKLPLGRNFKNKNKSNNKCWYVNYNEGLKPIRSYKYILNIKQIDTTIIKNIIEKYEEIEVLKHTVDEYEGVQVETTKGYLDGKYKTLPVYKKNIDHKATIEEIQRIELEGIKAPGTRHNLLYDLCRYYKHNGLSIEDNQNELIDWMNSQDPNTYRTPLKDCMKDIKGIVKHIYENDVTLTIETKEIVKVTYDEMLQILNIKNKNEKLLTYSMLIHSKRYAAQNGTFYMTYKQMNETTGLSDRTVKRLVNKLEENGIIEIIERNRKVISNNKLITKKPNIYKMLIEVDIEEEIESNYITIDNDIDLNNAMLSLFELNVLKKVLPDRHYREIYSVSNI